jgi:fructose-bisphosphate aldolase class II
MPKVNSKVLFDAAKQHRFIVGAFNFRHPNGLLGVAEAARECGAVYLAELAKSEYGYCGWTLRSYHDAVVEANERAGNKNPFGLHGDHVTVKDTSQKEVESSRRLVLDEIAAGWTSMAIDASHNQNEDNLKITTDLAQPVQDAGLGLEVEIGEIGGERGFSTPEEAEWFVGGLVKAGIKPDLLAINNGSVHGNYGPGTQEGIQLELTRRIGEVIKPYGAAIAQHGITGTPLDKMGHFVEALIAKGNVATLFQNINYGLKMDPHGNTVYDANGHFIKLPDEGIPMDLWEEILTYMDANGIKRGSGNVKKLNKPFYQKMLDIPPACHDRINRRTKEWALALFKAFRSDGKGAACLELQKTGKYAAPKA